MRAHPRLAALLLCLACLLPTRSAAAGNEAYLEGLDALAHGDFDAARKRFEAAVEENEDDAAPHLALAIAWTFLERFEPALKQVDRADRLQPGQKSTRLWKATIVAMAGRLFEDTDYYPAATRDPFETDLREMSHRYGDPAFRATKLHEPVANADAVRAKERAGFPDLARRFVERIRPATPELRPALAARGIGRFQKGVFAAAYPDLLDAVRMDPSDVQALLALAGCRLQLGAPEGARADYTRCLTKDTTWKDAYVGRALAHAALGDAAAAKADLEHARALGVDVAAAVAEVSRRLPPTPPDVPATLADLLHAPDRAGDFVRAFESRRKRADETYQEGLRAAREAGDLTALGAYLYDQATTTLVEWVEPRAEPTTVRPQDPEAELVAAEQALDAALAKNPDDVRAIAYRAACRMQRFEWERAAHELDGALAKAPEDPLVLELVAQVRDHAAAVQAAAAADLRRVTTWSDYWYVYTRWPSSAEIQQAGQLDQAASRLWGQARTALAAAEKASAGTARGDLLRARLAEVDGDLPTALEACRSAVKRDATSAAALRKLSELEGRSGHAKEAYEAQFRAANFTHSTSAPLLKLAWIEIARTAFKGAKDALLHAESGDPADPRLAAYRGALAEAHDDPEDALAWYTVAAKIAQARLASSGVLLGETGTRLRPEDPALAMRLAFRVARLNLSLGKPEAALAALVPVEPLLARVPVADRYRGLPSAMLPGPAPESGIVPPAPNLETIAAWIHLRMGDALARLGRPAEALPQFVWVVSFEQRKPSIADPGSEIREPAALAAAHLAKTLLALHRVEDARRARLSVPLRRDLPPASQAELEAVRDEVDAALGGGR